MANELKSCPLCGCHGIQMRSNPLNDKEHTIKCEDCPAGAQFFSSTADQAIEAWNRRPDTRAMGVSAVTDDADLRRMLCIAYAGAKFYGDDGELQDNREFPCIDFKRDSVAEIQRKINERGNKALAKFLAEPSAPQPSAKALTDEQRQSVRDAVAQALGDAFDCTRVWDAWQVGTMRQDDFSLVCEDDERLDEITDAAIGALLAAEQPSEDKRDGTVAARDVLAERRRQIEAEGWSSERDDEHRKGEIAMAAACYALAGSPRDLAPALWPWPLCWWKPKDPRRNLVKAGALILAEIERLDRAAIAKGEGK